MDERKVHPQGLEGICEGLAQYELSGARVFVLPDINGRDNVVIVRDGHVHFTQITTWSEVVYMTLSPELTEKLDKPLADVVEISERSSKYMQQLWQKGVRSFNDGLSFLRNPNIEERAWTLLGQDDEGYGVILEDFSVAMFAVNVPPAFFAHAVYPYMMKGGITPEMMIECGFDEGMVREEQQYLDKI